ncbi:MAG TPA: hypothetical protein VF647_06985, partial [Longimicrobium sp.]
MFRTAAIVFILLFGSEQLSAQATGAAGPVTALVGGTLIDGTGRGPIAGATVVMREGRIVCAGTGCTVPAGARRVDVRGKYVIPGLVDAH